MNGGNRFSIIKNISGTLKILKLNNPNFHYFLDKIITSLHYYFYFIITTSYNLKYTHFIITTSYNLKYTRHLHFTGQRHPDPKLKESAGCDHNKKTQSLITIPFTSNKKTRLYVLFSDQRCAVNKKTKQLYYLHHKVV